MQAGNGLSPREIRGRLYRAAGTVLTLDAREMIYRQGEQADKFHYLLSGRVRTFFISAEGQERSLFFLDGGHSFGESAFFERAQHDESAQTLTTCEICTVEREALRTLMVEHPDVALSTMQWLSHKMRIITSQLESMAFVTADRRIAQTLLQLSRNFSHRENARSSTEIAYTQEDIAMLSGTNRVTVTRVLKAMQGKQWIETGYGSIRLLDLQAIEAFVEG